MILSIRNFRGITSADIDIESIALIAGPNAAGKTSIAQALASAVTGEPIPIPGLRKQDAGMLVRSGGGASTVRLSDSESEMTITYPAARIASEGSPLTASRVACGIDSPALMDLKSRSDYLAGLLGTAPNKEALIKASGEIGMAPDHAEKLWASIDRSGWDGTHAHAKETGARLKGQWEEITQGERYGSSKADTWLPAKWESDLEGQSEETLQTLVVQGREFVEAAVVSQAIDAEQQAQLEAAAAALPDLQKQFAEAETAHHEYGEKITAALAKKAGLPQPVEQKQVSPCPWCSKPLVIVGASINKHEGEPADNLSRGANLIHVERLISELTKAQQGGPGSLMDRLRIKIMAAEQCAQQLAAPKGDQKDTDINATREARDRGEQRLEAFKRKRRADQIHASVTMNAAVVAMLAPDGLRQKALRDGLKRINTMIAADVGATQWGACEIAEDLSIWYGSRPYNLCSTSEQFRARILLQLSVATIDESDLVIIDNADILDRSGRNGLVKMLGRHLKDDLASLICMTLLDRGERSGREDATAMSGVLSGKEWGAAWWVEDGQAAKL